MDEIPMMTMRELKRLLARDECEDGVQLYCPSDKHYSRGKVIKVTAVHKVCGVSDQVVCVCTREDGDVTVIPASCIENYCAIEYKEPVPRWRWKLWRKGSVMMTYCYYTDAQRLNNFGFVDIIKAEKHGDPEYLIEGQEGYNA